MYLKSSLDDEMGDDFASEAKERAERAREEGNTEKALALELAGEYADSPSGTSRPVDDGRWYVSWLVLSGGGAIAVAVLLFAGITSVFAGVVAAPWYIPFGLVFPGVDPLQTGYWDGVLWVHAATGCALFGWVVSKRLVGGTASLSDLYDGRVSTLDGLAIGAGFGVSVGSFALFTAIGALGVSVPASYAMPLVGGVTVAGSLGGGVLASVVGVESLVRSKLFPLWRSALLWAVTLTVTSLYTNAVFEGLINPPYAVGSGGVLTTFAVVVAVAVPVAAVFLQEPLARLCRDGLLVVGLGAVFDGPAGLTVPVIVFSATVVAGAAVLTTDLWVRYRGDESALTTVTRLWGRATARDHRSRDV